ncbi:MAG: type I-E CRISPR-associated protein Cas7/Cse4/CasC, partial [Limisphaerales bacterium]
SPDQSSYPSGTVVTLTATANPGYTFTGWSGDLTGTTNPITITMNANKTVTATFVLAASTATVTVGSATLAAGGSAVVDVTAVIPAGRNVGAMQFSLTYDSTKISILSAGVTAGALTNSFAANNPPSLALAAVRQSSMGWSLANAFERPVHPTREGGLVAPSVEALDRTRLQ